MLGGHQGCSLRGNPPKAGGFPPTQQLFKSYKFKLISFHLNNECFRDKAWDAWFRTSFKCTRAGIEFFNKTIYISIFAHSYTHMHTVDTELEMLGWAWHQELLTWGTTHPKAAEDLDYFCQYQSPKVSPGGLCQLLLRQPLQFSRKFHVQQVLQDSCPCAELGRLLGR